jgi:tetratricopeptide (TPR) repeat protein
VNRFDSEKRDRAVAILREVESGGNSVEAARRAVAVDETAAVAWSLLGISLLDEGDSAGAIEAVWKALRTAPWNPMPYMLLSNALRESGIDKSTAYYATILGLRATAAHLEVPEVVAEQFSKLDVPSDIDFEDPAVYPLLAQTLEDHPPEGIERTMPESLVAYDLLVRLCMQARMEVQPEVLGRVRATPECIPLFRTSLREWTSQGGSLSSPSLGLVAAVLGELDSPEVLHDLLQLCDSGDDTIFAHVNWAVWRLGQRLPVETLATFVEAIPSASASLRCALAEQLGSLPVTVNAESALRALLVDLPDDDEAAYVVIAVSDALARRGHRSSSRSAYAEGLKLLSGEARKWAEERVRKRDFTPRLVEEDITGYTLEEVCFDRLMMEEEEEEEDDDLEEGDEPPVVRPGRNDPCWCGSGKKYKKCHLASDEEAPPTPDRQRLLFDILEGAKKWQTNADIAAAKEQYFGMYSPHEIAETEAPAFFEWLIRDFRSLSSGRTAVEEFLRRRGHELTAADRRMVEAWRDSRYGVFEVQRVEEGKGVEIKDYFTDEHFFVHDVTSSKELVKWDCLLSRVEQIQGRWEFSGDGLNVPRMSLPRVLEFIEKERGALSPSEFVRTSGGRIRREVLDLFDNAAMPQLQNTDGEPLEFSAAVYDVTDEPALLAALRAAPSLVEGDKSTEFSWIGAAGLGKDTSLGRVAIADGKLTLECNSRQRLVRGKKLLEDAAGKSIRYVRDRYETPAAARARMKDMPIPEPPKIDPELEREIVLKAEAEHYSTWADHPLPALHGLTPRAAMATAEGRKAVLDLIRMFENGAERNRKAGRPAFDFSGLRADLGLDPE